MQAASNVHALRTIVDTRPAPLLPPDIDLRGFHYLPLTPDKLTGAVDWSRSRREPFYAYRLFALFFAAFRQTPSGSLPNEDWTLADILGVDDNTWLSVKSDVLQEWVLCSDDRWHHPVIASCVADAWSKHRGNKDRPKKATEAAAQKRAADRDGGRDGHRDANHNDGKGNGEESTVDESKSDSKQHLSLDGDRKALFDRFWAAYPHKVQKGAAERAFAAAYKLLDGDVDRIMSGLARYVASTPADRPWRNPATFLNGKGYDDAPAAARAPAVEEDPVGVFRDRGGNGLNDCRMRKSVFEARYGKFPRGPYYWEPLPPDAVTEGRAA